MPIASHHKEYILLFTYSMTVESADSTPHREDNKDWLITPTPLERELLQELYQRFGVRFERHVLMQRGLVRTSTPVAIGAYTGVFQHERFNPLRGSFIDLIGMMRYMTYLNPILHQEISRDQQRRRDTVDGKQDSYYDFKEFDEGERFLQAIEERAEKKSGGYDPVQALSDPTYFTEGKPLIEWPGSFVFSLFEKGKLSKTANAQSLGFNGKLGEVRPILAGNLAIPTVAKDPQKASGYSHWGRDDFTIYTPQQDYITTQAYFHAMSEHERNYRQNPEDPDYLPIKPLTDMGSHAPHAKIILPFHAPDKATALARKLGAFIQELAMP